MPGEPKPYWGDKHQPFVKIGTDEGELRALADAIVRGASIAHAEVADLQALIEAVQSHPNVSLRPPKNVDAIGDPSELKPTALFIHGGRVDTCDCARLDIRVTLTASMRFGDEVGFGGAIFGAKARFTGATFGDQAHFVRAIFGERARFERVTFGDDAHFSGATFGDWADFAGATFGEHAIFTSAIFGDMARFLETSFAARARLAKAIFGNRANFDSTTFGERVRFSGASFGANSSFVGAIFSERSSFAGVTFGNRALFDGASFGEHTIFDGAIFAAGARFYRVTFGGESRFDEATFGERASFVRAIFGNQIGFVRARFGKEACFDAAIFGELARFAGATFGDHARFANATFGNRANFVDCNLNHAAIKDAGFDRADLRRTRGILFDETRIAQVQMEGNASDPWSKLRRQYTGPWFFVHLILLIIFFAPYVANVLALTAAAKLQENMMQYTDAADEKVQTFRREHPISGLARPTLRGGNHLLHYSRLSSGRVDSHWRP